MTSIADREGSRSVLSTTAERNHQDGGMRLEQGERGEAHQLGPELPRTQLGECVRTGV